MCFSAPVVIFRSIIAFIQLVESYRSILEQAQSITGVNYLPSVNGNGNTAGGRPTSASPATAHRGGEQGALTQEAMNGMLQNATYGMQMLDVALRAKSQLAPGPPTSQHYPQHQHQHPSQSHHQPHHHQPPPNSTSSLTAPSTQIQPPPSTPVTTGPSSGSYGYNTNSHPHPNQNSSSNSSSPRVMKDGGGVKNGVDDGGRKVKSESGMDKGVPANGNLSSGATTANATAAVAAGVSAGSTAPTGGDRSKRQVGPLPFCLQHIFTFFF